MTIFEHNGLEAEARAAPTCASDDNKVSIWETVADTSYNVKETGRCGMGIVPFCNLYSPNHYEGGSHGLYCIYKHGAVCD